jgi:hypothetical protein
MAPVRDPARGRLTLVRPALSNPEPLPQLEGNRAQDQYGVGRRYRGCGKRTREKRHDQE